LARPVQKPIKFSIDSCSQLPDPLRCITGVTVIINTTLTDLASMICFLVHLIYNLSLNGIITEPD